MARREFGSGHQHVGSTVVGAALRHAAIAVVLAVLMAPQLSQATTLNVVGGPGLDQGALCGTGNLCPTNAIFSLIGAAPVAGAFTYNVGPQTVDFTLTLTGNANFGAELLLAGSTFSATGVPVISLPFGSGILLVQAGAANGLAGPVLTAPFLPLVQNTPVISGLTCSIGTGSDQCGVSLGSSGLQLGTFDAFLTFNTAVVPLPAAVWLFGSALGLAGVLRRRVAA